METNQTNEYCTSFKWNETKSMYTHVARQDFKWKHIDNVTFLWNILLYPNLRMDAILQGSLWCTWAVSKHSVFFLLFSQELPQEMKCRMYVHTVMPCPFSRWDKWWWSWIITSAHQCRLLWLVNITRCGQNAGAGSIAPWKGQGNLRKSWHYCKWNIII